MLVKIIFLELPVEILNEWVNFQNHSYREKWRSPLTMYVKSSFSQTKLGLTWGILIQNWVRIAINKSNPVICLNLAGKCPVSPAL